MTFNPARTDLRPCLQSALMRRLGVEENEPVEAAMRALLYHGPGQRAWEEAPDPGALKVVLSRPQE